MNFRIAHFSDVHLGPLPPGAPWRNFRLKRLVGAASWALHRRHVHLPMIADALRADVQAAGVDHVAFTGDGTNIASVAEFQRLRAWMQEFGAADQLSYTPGNHDAYVPLAYDKGLALLREFMAGDMKQEDAFPFVRLRRNIALIGLNSAEPRGLHSAQGTLGQGQRERLRERLDELGRKGFFRLVMIHHPPGPKLAAPLRALTDAAALQSILCKAQVELVIYGHSHMRSLNWLEEHGSRVPAVGVASASMSATTKHPAEWNLYEISRHKGQWQTQVYVKQWKGAAVGFETVNDFLVTVGAP